LKKKQLASLEITVSPYSFFMRKIHFKRLGHLGVKAQIVSTLVVASKDSSLLMDCF